MLRILLSLILLHATSTLLAQYPCGTTTEEQASTFSFLEQNIHDTPSSSRSIIEVPVKVHIIGGTNGVFAADSVDVMEEIEIMNAVFGEIDIVFTLCGDINYINNNAYITFIKNEDEFLCDVNDEPNVINLYIPPNLEKSNGEGLCGYAYNFDIKTRVFVEKNCLTNGSTLTHEFGHAFSLLHTHSTSNGEELANGSNCSAAGDLLCDTPADPQLNSDLINEDCEYVGTLLDNQQNAYNPDPNNLMSYAPKECRTIFSPQQKLQMENFFFANGDFLACTPNITSTQSLNSNSIKVYPNPASEVLYVDGTEGESEIALYNTRGMLISKWQINANADNVSEVKIPADLPSGHYQIKIISNKITTAHRIIIL